MTLARIPDVSCLPIIDATPFFDRRWGLERIAKEVLKRHKLRGPARILIPPRRAGGTYREIRYDGKKFYELKMRVLTLPRTPSKKPKASSARPKKAPRRKPRPPSFLWRDWPPMLQG